MRDAEIVTSFGVHGLLSPVDRKRKNNDTCPFTSISPRIPIKSIVELE